MLKFSEMNTDTIRAADLSGLRDALEMVQLNYRRFHERLGNEYSDESWDDFWEETDSDWELFLNQIKKVLDAVRY